MARPRHHDRTDKLAEAHDRLAQAVEALVTGDDWQIFCHGSQTPTSGATLGYCAPRG